MSTPFLGEIRIFSFNVVPKGWVMCAGQLLAINSNQALFSILGTTYGGDGRNTFALPDLRGRTAVEAGPSIVLGEKGGEEFHTLIGPEAGHPLVADVEATTNRPAGAVLARGNAYTDTGGGVSGSVGGGAPHENRAPFLVLVYAIALQGIFPSQN